MYDFSICRKVLYVSELMQDRIKHLYEVLLRWERLLGRGENSWGKNFGQIHIMKSHFEDEERLREIYCFFYFLCGIIQLCSNIFYQKLLRIFTNVTRALKRHHAKRGASAEAEVRENALHTNTMF
jgi:hypothetical protein